MPYNKRTYLTPIRLPIYHFFPNYLLIWLTYLICSIHALGWIPQISPKHVFVLPHCLNRPTRKHTEITDNRIIKKPSNLIILNPSVLSAIYRVQDIVIYIEIQRYSAVHVKAFNICSASAVILWMKRHRVRFTRTTLLISVLYKGLTIAVPK